MGSMLTFIIGILLAVWLAFHQIAEHYRFDLVSDSKNGGVFIIDKRNASLNYCDTKTCVLVGSGVLPSQIMNNPSALASLQNAIMGAPAPVSAPQPGQAPTGMEKNLASSGAPKADHPDEEKPQEADEEGASEADSSSDKEQDADKTENEEKPDTDEKKDDAKEDSEDKPEGFDF